MAAPSLDGYKPEFFSAEEWSFILAACDRLIPSGGRGPGALETNVPIFIDQQLAGDLGSEIYLEGPFDPNPPATLGYQLPFGPQEVYRRTIAAIDRECQQNHGKRFALLDATLQDDVLHQVQSSKVALGDAGEGLLSSGHFFSELLSNTQQGYLSDPMYGGNKGMKAWIAIGFPGARASYLEWVKQHNVPYPLGPVSVSGERA